MNCWEFMRCGREAGGRNTEELGICPAYPDNGKRCANVVGTFCDLIRALRASENSSCSECPFYNSHYFDKVARLANQEKGV